MDLTLNKLTKIALWLLVLGVAIFVIIYTLGSDVTMLNDGILKSLRSPFIFLPFYFKAIKVHLNKKAQGPVPRWVIYAALAIIFIFLAFFYFGKPFLLKAGAAGSSLSSLAPS